MLTDRELGALSPKERMFKVADRDGLYVAVLPTGTRAFRYDYRLNGRRETLAIGRYDSSSKATRDPEALEYGMSLSLREARTLLDRARRDVERGVSPSHAKAEKRAAAAEALTFGGWADKYFKHKADPKSGAEQLADSTLELRRSTYRRVIEPVLGRLKLEEVTPQRLMRLCLDAKEKRGPAVGVHVREEANRRNTFTDAEVERIVKVLDDYIKTAEKDLKGEGNVQKAVGGYYLGVSLISGLRRGEQLQLRWTDIDNDLGYREEGRKNELVKIRVRGETSKVRQTRRFIVSSSASAFCFARISSMRLIVVLRLVDGGGHLKI